MLMWPIWLQSSAFTSAEAKINYYEHHIGDYAEATAHLSFVEDAAYSRLIRKYYAQEKPLPVDVKAVQRLIAARSKEEREAVVTVLDEFFELRDDGWHQDRCDSEVARYQDKQAKAKASADARWNKSKPQTERNANASPNAMRTHSEGNAHQTPHTSHQSPDPNPTLETSHANPTGVGAEAEGGERCTPAQMSGFLLRQSIRSNPGDPRLMAIAEQGVTIATLQAACETAKRAKPGENIPLGYVLSIVESWAKKAAELKAKGASPPTTKTEQRRAFLSELTGASHEQRPSDPTIIDIN